MEMTNTNIKLLVLIPLLVLVSQAKGAEHLTINGNEVDSINLSVDQSCTIEVVSDGGALPYIKKLDPTNFNLSDLELIEIKPEAGAGASVIPLGGTEYKLSAGTGMVAGVHFVFGYTATATGQKDVELKALLGGDPIDSISINVTAAPAGTAFTYQGRLLDNSTPAEGIYEMEFKLYESVANPIQLGETFSLRSVEVADGYFMVQLDFGSDVFSGDARWLEIGVRQADTTNPFVTMSPRQKLTPTPYALQTRGLYVDNDLKVGLGTISPEGKLHVATKSACGDIVFFDAGSAQNDLSTDPDSVYTDIIPRAYVVQVTSASGSPDLFKWSDDSGVTWSSDQLQMTTGWYALSHGVRIKWDDINGHLPGDTWAWFAFSSEANALVAKNGKLGVGTSNPAWKLEVANPRAGESVEAGVSADDAGGAMAAYSSTYSAYPQFADRVSVFSNAQTATGLDLRADGSDSDIRFYTGGIETSNVRMIITDDGNVGIGMWPVAKLDVDGPIHGACYTNSYAVHGYSHNTSGVGVYGHSDGGRGVWGTSDGGTGVSGECRSGTSGTGVYGWSQSGKAIHGETSDGYAGYFEGDVYVTENVSAKSFTDRTPYPKGLATAYDAVMSMERLPDGQYDEMTKENQLDHSKLSSFIQSEDGNRDLSATVSCQNEVLKDLVRKFEVQQQLIETQNAQIQQLTEMLLTNENFKLLSLQETIK